MVVQKYSFLNWSKKTAEQWKVAKKCVGVMQWSFKSIGTKMEIGKKIKFNMWLFRQQTTSTAKIGHPPCTVKKNYLKWRKFIQLRSVPVCKESKHFKFTLFEGFRLFHPRNLKITLDLRHTGSGGGKKGLIFGSKTLWGFGGGEWFWAFFLRFLTFDPNSHRLPWFWPNRGFWGIKKKSLLSAQNLFFLVPHVVLIFFPDFFSTQNGQNWLSPRLHWGNSFFCHNDRNQIFWESISFWLGL